MGTIFYTAPVAPHVLINAFFLYSFLGWVMECIVIRREKGRWENRGFAHLPFCIIYGFGVRFPAIMCCSILWEPFWQRCSNTSPRG